MAFARDEIEKVSETETIAYGQYNQHINEMFQHFKN